MLRRDVLELLCSGEAWAFVGSGVSAEAGAPTWGTFVESVLENLPEAKRNIVLGRGFAGLIERHDYPSALAEVEAVAGRQELESLVRRALDRVGPPGPLLNMLADLPFAGYITTNYDHLIERALNELGLEGWISVGNTEDEIPKVGGAAERIVWHIHGGLDLSAEKSHLVLTSQDYDDLYLEENDFLRQLRGLLTHRRLVFVGFSFADAEFMRLLRRVGRLTDPARPVVAFLSSADTGDSGHRHVLRHLHNVDVISYRVVNDSHKELVDLVSSYASLTLRRSLHFRDERRAVPSYDTETTGLLLYNELVLKSSGIVADDILSNLVDARLTSKLKHSGELSKQDLVEDLESRIRLLMPDSSVDGDHAGQLIEASIVRLSGKGFIEPANETSFRLTAMGNGQVREKAARAALLGDQFSASIAARAAKLVDGARAQAVASTAESFLKHCIETRSLGVAMASASPSQGRRDYQMVALLQSLPEFMEQLADPGEAVALSRLIRDVLATPNDRERQYIGLAVQAQFAAHLLGYDLASLGARIRTVVETCFVIDAHNIIPFLAVDSPGHESTRLVIAKLQQLGSGVLSTLMLAEEVAEHARWAMKQVATSGHFVVGTLEAASGRAGQRSNAFVDGLVEQVDRGKRRPNLFDYLTDVFGTSRGEAVTRHDVAGSLERAGIPCRSIDEWDGFEEGLWADIDEASKLIAKKRRGLGTYRHDRQVQAEAEIVVLISQIRENFIHLSNLPCKSAFFVSNTRILDDLAHHQNVPVTMQSEQLLHWLATLAPIPDVEITAFTSSLLGELAALGLAVVDERKLHRVFGPLISAGKEALAEELEKHGDLVADAYGADALLAFSDVSDLEAPIVADSLHRQRAEYLEAVVAREKQAREEADRRATMSQRDKADLDRLKRRQEERARRSKQAKRRSASKPGSKKRKKKRG